MNKQIGRLRSTYKLFVGFRYVFSGHVFQFSHSVAFVPSVGAVFVRLSVSFFFQVPLGGFATLQGMRGIQKFNIHKAFGGSHLLPAAHTWYAIRTAVHLCTRAVRFISNRAPGIDICWCAVQRMSPVASVVLVDISAFVIFRFFTDAAEQGRVCLHQEPQGGRRKSPTPSC